jgi:hypothetical protein
LPGVEGVVFELNGIHRRAIHPARAPSGGHLEQEMVVV